MPIMGIDYDKCVSCCACLAICPFRLFDKKKGTDQVVFQGERARALCNLCGHCIAGCAENAILHRGMGESQTFDGVENPQTILSYDLLYRLLRAHRSVRRYKKDKVSPDILDKIFHAMQYAPTAGNLRSENISILSDNKKIEALSDAVQKELLGNLQLRAMYGEVIPLLAKEYTSPVFYDAPHVIFVSSGMEAEFESNTIGVIITYGSLAAETLGLGTCWNGLAQIAMNLNPKIKELAGIHGSKIGVFTVGYPDVTFYHVPPRVFKAVKGL